MLKRCRCAECFNTNVVSLATGVFAPAKVGCLFHRDSGLHSSRQNRLSVASVLVVKQFPRWHTNETSPYTLLAQSFIGLQAECNLAARPDEDDFGVGARGICQHIGSACQTRCCCVFLSVDGGHGLASEYKHRRL